MSLKKLEFNWDAIMGVFTIIAAVLALATYLTSVDTARKQLQAYVGIDDIQVRLPSSKLEKYKPDAVLPGHEFKDFITVKLRNSGTTPAPMVKIQANWKTIPYGEVLPDDFNFIDYERGSKQHLEAITSNFALFSGATKDVVVAIKDAGPFLDAVNRRKSLYLYGHIDYKDIYDQAHKTNFCYELEVLDAGVLKLTPATDHQEVQ